MQYDSPWVLLLVLVCIGLSGVFAVFFCKWMDKWSQSGKDGIEEAVYLGPGDPRAKKFGAKGVVYGAALGGLVGAMWLPFVTREHKQTARFRVTYSNGKVAEKEAVVGSVMYKVCVRHMK